MDKQHNEGRVSLREDTPTPQIDPAELAEQARTRSRRELASLIERHQEQLVEDLCGSRYSRSHPHRRGGSCTKSLVTCLGEIRFKAMKIIRRSDGKTATLILGVLDVKRRRYYRGIRIRLAEFASKMSYGDACIEFETATGVHLAMRLGSCHRDGRYVKSRTHRRYEEAFHETLEGLGTDHVSIINIHYVKNVKEWEVVTKPKGVLDLAVSLRDDGLSDPIAMSTHDARVVRRAAEYPEIDSVMYQVNMANHGLEGRDAALRLCAETGMGVVAM